MIVSEFICMLNFKKYLLILIGELDSSAAENFGEAYSGKLKHVDYEESFLRGRFHPSNLL